MNATTFTAQIALQQASDRAAWMFIGKAFQDHSSHCEQCPKHELERDGEPGKFAGYCTLGERVSDRPTHCAAYVEHLNTQDDPAEQGISLEAFAAFRLGEAV